MDGLMGVALEALSGVLVVRVDDPLGSALPALHTALSAAVSAESVVLDLLARPPEGLADLRLSGAQWRLRERRLRAVCEVLTGLRAVAAVRGSAVGGWCSLVAACRVRVLAEDAELGGVVGTSVLSGWRVDAARALRSGLADRVVSAERVRRVAVELANERKLAQAGDKSCRIVAP